MGGVRGVLSWRNGEQEKEKRSGQVERRKIRSGEVKQRRGEEKETFLQHQERSKLQGSFPEQLTEVWQREDSRNCLRLPVFCSL
jgi:hypothetical protein